MLSQRIPQWLRESEAKGEARGEAGGKIIGEAETLLKLLELKFGPLPQWVEPKIDSASKEQLDHWVEGILTADTLDSLFG